MNEQTAVKDSEWAKRMIYRLFGHFIYFRYVLKSHFKQKQKPTVLTLADATNWFAHAIFSLLFKCDSIDWKYLIMPLFLLNDLALVITCTNNECPYDTICIQKNAT